MRAGSNAPGGHSSGGAHGAVVSLSGVRDAEIETIFQVLSVGDESSGGGGGAGGGGPGGSGGVVCANRDNEWMYHLERHGGAELHNMAVAFDAFRAGNLGMASTLYETVLGSARAHGYTDRFIVNRVRQLADGSSRAAAQPAAATPSGDALAAVAGAAAASSQGGFGPAGDAASITSSPGHLSSTLIGTQSSALFDGGWQEDINAGGELVRARPDDPTVTNPRRIALETFFAQLRELGLKYARRSRLTGVDDMPFE
jgi:hypothetical protein